MQSVFPAQVSGSGDIKYVVFLSWSFNFFALILSILKPKHKQLLTNMVAALYRYNIIQGWPPKPIGLGVSGAF